MKSLTNLITLLKLYLAYSQRFYPKTYTLVRFFFSLFYLFLFIKRIILLCLMQWSFCLITVLCLFKEKQIIFLNTQILYITVTLIILCFFYMLILLLLHKPIHDNIYLNIMITIFFAFIFSQIISSFFDNPFNLLMLNTYYLKIV